MSEHFKSFSAVFPIIIEKNENKEMVLIHRRENTGYQDGKWDIAGSGHVDEGETAKEAAVRECKEELGIDVKTEDIEFVHLSHRFTENRTYYDIYFRVNHYRGRPAIMEPEKCSELMWFDIENLPEDMIACRVNAIREYMENNYYSESVEK
jgi:ADP-ribose pyrophosphatase